MAFDPIKIPQNVYVEDRVIGPVSLRQIFMILGGGGVSYVLWSLMTQAGVVSVASGTIAAIPTVVMLMFAFVKISQIPLSRFCLLMIERSKKPAIRYWQPRTGIELRPYKASAKPEPESKTEPKAKKSSADIEALSSVLDTDAFKKKEVPAADQS